MNHAVKSLQIWLFGCAALVFLMVMVGAITRLTESGLSITEWRPITGIVPPLKQSEWIKAFDLYKQSPEFIKENFWMDLEDFKQIFFWEWFHRFLGRLIGLVYALPLFYFWIRKQIPSGFKLPLLILLILGGMQGVVGWVMVKSGLVDQPSVSHYRLASHLLLALLIYALLIWNALALAPFKKSSDKILYAHAWAVAALLTLTLLWGAFTAGLDAGLIYNESFPQMGGQWIPTEITNAAAPLHALFESPAGVQFTHRCLAIVTFACIISFWLHAWRRKNTFPAIHALMVMGFIQVGLGISTLLSGVELPLAVMHQAGAVLVLTFLVMSLKRLEA